MAVYASGLVEVTGDCLAQFPFSLGISQLKQVFVVIQENISGYFTPSSVGKAVQIYTVGGEIVITGLLLLEGCRRFYCRFFLKLVELFYLAGIVALARDRFQIAF